MNTQLLDAARRAIQTQHKSQKTEHAYLDWIYRFLVFHQKASVSKFSTREVQSFLRFLTTVRKVSPATQNQALQALIFFYKHVLQMPLADVSGLRACNSCPAPKVLTRAEMASVLNELKGEAWLMASLLYGCGLRLNECLSLRIKHIDLVQKRLIINSDAPKRIIAIPERLIVVLTNRMQLLRLQYEQWMQEGFCGVAVPEQGDETVSISWPWQYLFPAGRPIVNETTGKRTLHHRSESFLEKAVKQAALKAQLSKTISCHAFRNSFATHLLENGYTLRTVQTLLGHCNVRSTKVYARIATAKTAVRSPLDELH